MRLFHPAGAPAGNALIYTPTTLVDMKGLIALLLVIILALAGGDPSWWQMDFEQCFGTNQDRVWSRHFVTAQDVQSFVQT